MPRSTRWRNIVGWIATVLFFAFGVYSLAWGQQRIAAYRRDHGKLAGALSGAKAQK